MTETMSEVVSYGNL